MNKDFVQYPEALELKGLGYPQNGYFAWYAHDGLHYDSEYIEEDFTYACCAAPTYSQAFRWFREKYNLEGIVQHAEERLWYKFHISTYLEYGKKNIHAGFEYASYEEAELACLKKLIEIVKENAN
jgi:hypothetical protein